MLLFLGHTRRGAAAPSTAVTIIIFCESQSAVQHSTVQDGLLIAVVRAARQSATIFSFCHFVPATGRYTNTLKRA